jgi:hypothetical protein
MKRCYYISKAVLCLKDAVPMALLLHSSLEVVAAWGMSECTGCKSTPVLVVLLAGVT